MATALESATTTEPVASHAGDDTDCGEALYEVLDGVRVEVERMGAIQTVLASVIVQLMGPAARREKVGLLVTETLFVLDAARRSQRRPDVDLVPYSRWPDRVAPDANAWDVVPDLAVEIVSPTNLAEEVEEKLIEYFSAGVRLAWVVYPKTERIHVYGGAKQVSILDRADVIEGGEVLPGWSLPVAELFDAATRPE